MTRQEADLDCARDLTELRAEYVLAIGRLHNDNMVWGADAEILRRVARALETAAGRLALRVGETVP